MDNEIEKLPHGPDVIDNTEKISRDASSCNESTAAAGHCRPTALIAWTLGLLYTVAIGEFAFPTGVGATIVGLVVTGFLYYKGTKSRLQTVVTGFSLLLCLIYALYSNWLVLLVTDFSLLIAVLIQLCDTRFRRFPATHQLFIQESLSHALTVVSNLGTYIREYLRVLQSKHSANSSFIRTALVAVGSLTVFHFFFAEINREYSAFMRPVIEAIVDLFYYLVNISFLVAWLLQGLTIFCLLKVVDNSRAPEAPHALPSGVNIVGVLTPIALLTAVFSAFQIKFILIVTALLQNFKDFSLYVQRGFWELLAIAAIGFVFWLAGFYEWHTVRTRRILRYVLGIFLAELVFLCIFAAHKLYLLQVVFGLKDQRIFASLAVGLMLVSFLLCAAILLRKLPHNLLLKSQIILLFAAVSISAHLNIDSLITSLHPISFRNDHGQRVKDYSYLLTNSYDNVDDWSELIGEIILTPAVLDYPTDYYWGSYYPLCSEVRGHKRDNFERHLERASAQMRYSEGIAGLRERLRLNFSTYKINAWIRSNKETLAVFNTIVKQTCERNVANSNYQGRK